MNTHTSSPGPTDRTPAFYSTKELAEFEALVKQKLSMAADALAATKGSLSRASSNGTDDTYFSRLGMEDGTSSLEREELMMLATRQERFIEDLTAALGRIHAGTYGVCRVTGQLIPKERLRLVPHATLCMAAKQEVADRPGAQ